MKNKLFIATMLMVTLCLVMDNSKGANPQTEETSKFIGSTLQLLVDDWLIDKMNNVRLKLHSPERREVVFEFDKPWEGKESGYVTMLKDGSVFRMYYRGGGELSREYTCLAESPDGINWHRSVLGLFEFNGSKQNNIIWTGKEAAYYESHNFAPFIDQNPKALPEQRYKAVALGRYFDDKKERRKALLAMTSADGIHWQRMQEQAIITEGSFDSQNTAFWDVIQKQYVCYFRVGREGKRSISRCTSQDFLHWSKPEPLDFGATPLEHLYTNAIVQYFREPGFYLGFPMRFVPERKTIGFDSRAIDGVSDAVFMSSRDGIHWNRQFMEAFIRPGLNPHNWGNAHGNNTPAWGILPTAENEMSIYWCENYGSIPRLRRGTLRPDGFVSLNAPYRGGDFITCPLRFEGKNLIINYSTSAVGSIKVEILDQNGKCVPGFEASSCTKIYGDEIQRILSWNGKTDLGFLSNKSLRLHFIMKDADLYSVRFK